VNRRRRGEGVTKSQVKGAKHSQEKKGVWGEKIVVGEVAKKGFGGGASRG